MHDLVSLGIGQEFLSQQADADPKQSPVSAEQFPVIWVLPVSLSYSRASAGSQTHVAHHLADPVTRHVFAVEPRHHALNDWAVLRRQAVRPFPLDLPVLETQRRVARVVRAWRSFAILESEVGECP